MVALGGCDRGETEREEWEVVGLGHPFHPVAWGLTCISRRYTRRCIPASP